MAQKTLLDLIHLQIKGARMENHYIPMWISPLGQENESLSVLRSMLQQLIEN